MFSSIDVTQLTPEKDFCESEITKKYFDTPLIYYGLQNDHLEVKMGSCDLGSQIFEKKY